MTTEHPAIPLGDGTKRSSQTNVDRGAVIDDVDVDRRVADSAPEGARSAAHDTSYLPQQDTAHANERWQRIQAEFVDDPRKSVTEASQLVGDLTKRIADAFERERADLERQWSEGDKVSTEDLRVCLQRYRAFFSRLLPSVDGLDKH
ncbi:MAG TPA: hypothetical protein VGI70_19270 [Polyangiales bacterium]|jgi:hypothetical protein